MDTYDIVVIGAGPGGYVAAIRAAQSGLKTALVEKDKRLGGTCLLRGCIPTKSLLHSAELLDELKHAKNHGIVAGDVGFDFAGVQKARDGVVQKSALGVAYLMKQNKITVYQGWGRLKDPHTIEVRADDDKVTTLNAKKIILAMGSVPRKLPFLPIDGKHIVSSDEILTLPEPPKSLVVLGGGAVGVEFASIYSRFGSQCTVVEMMDHLLPIEDTDVGIELEKVLKKKGIAIHTATKLEKAEVKKGQVVINLSDKTGKATTIEAQMLLVAVGRAPVTENCGLDTAGVRVSKGGVVEVNAFMQTSVPHIYAIGDIVPGPLLAHVATAEAEVAATHAAGKHAVPINYNQIPSATYCDPEVASVGLTERAAKEQGYTVKVGKFPFMALGKARILGKTDGFVKIVSDAKYDEILGVHIIGAHATDLIAEACIAMRLEATTEELAHTIHAHPTLSESMLEAAHATLGHALHM